ncbi:sialidase family protein [Kiritimatiella glycovorans]|uniref:Putative neuraminidase (Sialidase) n=1 Tax=Kiritimatiella glycovorans TaxID=1307763 RepID=A0A0G3ELB3_9BACT|nr:sialidase family protein [Kiritimatiella glycovorans]AKJ64919.1 putative neuraminidase (sialidase) [Kiritimatiella glycovorans]
MKKTIKKLTALTVLLSALSLPAADYSDPEQAPRWPHMPYVVTDPGPEYDAENRMFVCSFGISAAPNGRLWATWDSGDTGEGWSNIVMLATSGDGGRTWSDPQMVIDPPFRASYAGLWMDPDDRMWFTFSIWPIRYTTDNAADMKKRFDDIRSYRTFVLENQCRGMQLWAITTDNPGDPSPEWDSPQLIATDYGHMNKPTVLSDGTWVWPVGTLTRAEGGGRLPFRPLFSTDKGRTFEFRGHVPMPEGRNCDENQVVQREDGSLWLLSRMNYGIGESFSRDQGKTWTPMEPSDIEHTVARFYIGRLQSGKLLLVKHGEPGEKTGRRERLMAFLSDDDGESWTGGLMIDERSHVSYPDATQADDGTIYVIYDRERHHAKEILMAAFTEQDVAAGEPVSGKALFRQVIDKGLARNPRHQGAREATPQWKRDENPPRDNADGAALRRSPVGAFAAGEVQVLAFDPGAKLFTDRGYALSECPEALKGARFLQVPIDGDKSVTVSRAGVVYFATPLPDRNPSGSQSAKLEAQGFEKVALSEFNLFEHTSYPANLCSLYQKTCAAGEVIEFGKWAVPLFAAE